MNVAKTIDALVIAHTIDPVHHEGPADIMRERMVALEQIKKAVEAKIKDLREEAIDLGLARLAEHARENAPGKDWWQENAPDMWPEVRKVVTVRTFRWTD